MSGARRCCRSPHLERKGESLDEPKGEGRAPKRKRSKAKAATDCRITRTRRWRRPKLIFNQFEFFLKITGREKSNPSSATRGGGGGTGLARSTITIAAWSKASSPELLAIFAERMRPVRSSVIAIKISAPF